jgi:hypothetical protein
MNAKIEMAHWARTDEPAEGPKSALSHFPVERSEHRILGDPGTQRLRWVIMAVQGFFRIRDNWHLPRGVGVIPRRSWFFQDLFRIFAGV